MKERRRVRIQGRECQICSCSSKKTICERKKRGRAMTLMDQNVRMKSGILKKDGRTLSSTPRLVNAWRTCSARTARTRG
jgi:hypothetical protein